MNGGIDDLLDIPSGAADTAPAHDLPGSRSSGNTNIQKHTLDELDHGSRKKAKNAAKVRSYVLWVFDIFNVNIVVQDKDDPAMLLLEVDEATMLTHDQFVGLLASRGSWTTVNPKVSSEGISISISS